MRAAGCVLDHTLLLWPHRWFALPKAASVVACRSNSTGVVSSLRSPHHPDQEDAPVAEKPGLCLTESCRHSAESNQARSECRSLLPNSNEVTPDERALRRA